MKTSICRLLSTPLQSSKAFNQAFSVLLIKVFKVMMSSCSPFSWTEGTGPSMFHHVFSQLKPQLSLVHPSNLRKPTLDTHGLSFKNNIKRKFPVFLKVYLSVASLQGCNKGVQHLPMIGPLVLSYMSWEDQQKPEKLGGLLDNSIGGRTISHFVINYPI